MPEAMRQYKLDLEVQIEQNRLRAQQERAEQKARVQEQRKVVTEYVTEQATLKKTAKQKQLVRIGFKGQERPYLPST